MEATAPLRARGGRTISLEATAFDEAAHFDRQRTRRADFSSATGALQRLLQAASTLVVMPLVLHALGAEGFGVWAAAASFAWMTTVFDFGVGQALLTRVARAAARGEIAAIRADLGAGLLATGGLALAAALLAIVAIPLVASDATRDAYLIAALCLAANAPCALGAGVWAGLQRVHVVFAWEAFQTIFTMAALFGASLVTQDVRWYVAATAGGLLVSNALCFAHLLLRRPDLAPAASWPDAALCRGLLAEGGPFVALAAAAMLWVNLDTIVALARLGADAAAQMGVAQRACVTIYGLLWAVTQPLWPAVAEAAARGDYPWARRSLARMGGMVLALILAGDAILILFGPKLIDIWMGGALRLPPEVFWAMAAWALALGLGRVVDVALNGLGAVRFQARVMLIFGVTAFAMKLVAAPNAGVAGIIAASALAFLLTAAPAYVIWLSRWSGAGGAPARKS